MVWRRHSARSVQPNFGFVSVHFRFVKLSPDTIPVRSNCKEFITGVRTQAAKAGSVAIQCDSTEALKIEHQKEVQAMRFGGMSLP